MYRAFRRKPFTLGLLILFSGVSLCGNGLHFLPGLDHAPHCGGHSVAAEVVEGGHSCSAHDDRVGNVVVVEPASHADADHGACAICDFLAQAQADELSPPAAIAPAPLSSQLVTRSAAPFLRRCLRLAARAPPRFGNLV